MQAFDVDTADELLTSARRSNEDVWWNVSEKHQQAKDRNRLWLITATVVAAVGLVVGLAALATSAVGARQSAIASRASGSSSSSAIRGSTPAWGQINRIAFSSCTSYDVRPQPIWTQASSDSLMSSRCHIDQMIMMHTIRRLPLELDVCSSTRSCGHQQALSQYHV